MSSLATQSSALAASTDGPLPIRAVGLGKSMDRRVILQDIHLDVRAGEYVAVIGANGAGKSTLLRILATLTTPSAGSLSLFGLSTSRELAKVRMKIGLVAHQAMLYRDLTARENLEFFGNLYGIPGATARANLLLNVVGLMNRANDPVRSFSRGMVQRVAIARALMHDPQLILADEPFDGLDAPSVASTEQLLAHLNKQGKTILLVNHDIRQTLRLAQRTVVLQRGRIVADRSTNELDAEGVLAQVAGTSGGPGA